MIGKIDIQYFGIVGYFTRGKKEGVSERCKNLNIINGIYKYISLYYGNWNKK